MKTPALALVASLALVAWLPAAAAEPVQVQAVSIHLFLTPTGEFSEDIAALEGFSSWNFTPAIPLRTPGRQFHSYLIKVYLKTAKEAYVRGKIASVEVRSQARKRSLHASTVSNLYFPAEGETVIARLIEGHVCEPVTILVSTATSRVTKNIDFQCGE